MGAYYLLFPEGNPDNKITILFFFFTESYTLHMAVQFSSFPYINFQNTCQSF